MADTEPTFPAPRWHRYVDRRPRPSYWSRFCFWLGLLQLPLVGFAVWVADKPGHPPGLFVTWLLLWPIGLLSVVGLLLARVALRKPPPRWQAWAGLAIHAPLFLISAGVLLATYSRL